MALSPRRAGQRDAAAPQAGAAWTARACSRATAPGGPSTRTTHVELVGRLPFCDFGEVIDPPSVDVTAHVLEMLAAPASAGHPTSAGVSTTSCGEQERGRVAGSAAGARTTSTGPAPPCRRWCAAVAAGARAIRAPSPGSSASRTTTAAGARICRSYVDRGWSGRGESTASQTAWALLALHAAGEDGERRERGLDWLVRARSAATAAGTSRTSPAPAFPATSTSTTTCTGSSSR